MSNKRQVSPVREARAAARRMAAHWVPLAVNTVGVGITATGLRELAVSGTGTAALTASLMTAVTGAGTAITWRHFGPRNKELRAAATVTVGYGLGTSTVLGAVGPWHWPGALVWLTGGAITGGYWLVRAWARHLGKSHDEGQGSGSPAAIEAVGGLAALAQAKVSQAQVSELGAATARLELPRGLDARQELAGTERAIASLIDKPASAVRIIPDPDRPRAATLEIDGKNYLAEPRVWPGASAPGENISVPLRAAYRANGAEVEISLSGNAAKGTPSFHLLVTGTTGSGKTDSVVGGVLLEALVRREVNLLVMDPLKAMQSYGFIAPYLWLESDRTRGRKILRRMVTDVITARTAYLGEHGHKQWKPGCGLNYLIMMLDEAYELVGDGKYDGVGQAARSGGVSIITGLPRASWDSTSTLWRAMHNAHWCHGVANEDDASFGLPDTMKGLVHPENWGISQPGSAFLSTPEISLGDAQRPVRSWKIDGHQDEIARYISTWRHHLGLSGDLDPVTAAAFGELWTSRTIYPDPYASEQNPQVTERIVISDAAAGTPARRDASTLVVDDLIDAELVVDHDGQDVDAEDVADDVADEQAALGDALGELADRAIRTLPEQERPHLAGIRPAAAHLADAAEPAVAGDLAGIDPAGERPRRSSGAVRSAWAAWLAERYQSGQTTLTREDAVAWAEANARSAAWADGQLKRLVADGDARQASRGVLVLEREPVDPLAALTLIK